MDFFIVVLVVGQYDTQMGIHLHQSEGFIYRLDERMGTYIQYSGNFEQWEKTPL